MIAGRYSLGHKLGAGMQAEVRAAKDTATGANVAVKIIDRTNMKSRALIALEREVCCWRIRFILTHDVVVNRLIL
jgi:serine/threonine protein kinase